VSDPGLTRSSSSQEKLEAAYGSPVSAAVAKIELVLIVHSAVLTTIAEKQRAMIPMAGASSGR
jgi:hypothetical protein